MLLDLDGFANLHSASYIQISGSPRLHTCGGLPGLRTLTASRVGKSVHFRDASGLARAAPRAQPLKFVAEHGA